MLGDDLVRRISFMMAKKSDLVPQSVFLYRRHHIADMMTSVVAGYPCSGAAEATSHQGSSRKALISRKNAAAGAPSMAR